MRYEREVLMGLPDEYLYVRAFVYYLVYVIILREGEGEGESVSVCACVCNVMMRDLENSPLSSRSSKGEPTFTCALSVDPLNPL